MAITRVQGNARNSTLGSPTSVTLNSTPTTGNVLIAVIGLVGASGVTSISQNQVNWSMQKKFKNASSVISEIWLGTVGSGASTTLTVYSDCYAGYRQQVNVCEYSGIATVSPKDQEDDNSGVSTTPDTGTTPPTTQSNELWIGATTACTDLNATQTNATQGFELLDGTAESYTYGNQSLAYLEKIVSSTGEAHSGTTSANTTTWSGCIATFKASATEFDDVTINNKLTMKAPNGNDWVDLQTVLMYGVTPVFTIDQGMMGIKDIQCFGFLGAGSPTKLQFGDTYTNCIPSDIGKPVKKNGNFLPRGDEDEPYTVLVHYDNQNKKWWLSRPHTIASGSAMTINGGTGAGTTSENSATSGGGAVMLGHGFEYKDDPPRINMTDWVDPVHPEYGKYDTLCLTAGSTYDYDTQQYLGVDGVLANMKLKELTATGGAKLNAIAIGMDEYGNIPYEYESIQMNPAHNLRFCFGTNERMVLSNAGRLELLVSGSNGGIKLGTDVQLYRSGTDTLTIADHLIVGKENLNINPSSGSPSLSLQQNGSTKGYFTHDGSNGYLSSNGHLTVIASGTSKDIVFYPTGNLRLFGGKWFLPEATGGSGQVGSSTYYWYRMYAGTYYGKNTTISYFDALDDLALLKNHKVKKVIKNGVEVEVVDVDSLPHLKPDEEEASEFYDTGKMHGYLIGCIKALLLRLEKLEEAGKKQNA